jgi:polar amino acid transport system substrate-binding protein
MRLVKKRDADGKTGGKMLRMRYWCYPRAMVCLIAVLALGIWPNTKVIAAPTVPATDIPALEFVTEEFPPLNFSNNGQADGFGSEVVRAILHRENLTAPMTVYPWARAYKLAQIQSNVGLYCLARTVEREKLFQWVGPIGNIESKFYTTSNSELHVDNFTDAKSAYAVIVLREGYSNQLLQRLGFKNIVPVTNATEAVRLMRISGDKTLMLLTSNALPEAMSKTATPRDAFKPLMIAMKTQVYIGFSLNTSPDLVAHLQHTLDQMKTDGSFAAIYQKWFPGEKPPGLLRDPDILPPN